MLAVQFTASQPSVAIWIAWVDLALLIAGGALVAGWFGRLAHSGRWRQPLDIPPSAPVGPRLSHALIVLFVYVLLAPLLGQIALPAASRTARISPGSSAFHATMNADMIARLLAVGVALYFIKQSATPAAAAERSILHGIRIIPAALLGTLAVHAVTTVQLQAGTVAWKWLRPDAPPPIHDILEAIHASEWGAWGALQLCVSAVIVAPFAEEVFFRGVLLPCIWKYTGHAWGAIVTTGALFGAVHVAQPQDVVPLAMMGVILGFVRVHYRSLRICILIHALFNARTMTVAIVAPELIVPP